jgi:hypothetical protein
LNEETFEQTPALTPSGAKLFPLDWRTTEIKLAKGRFVHTISRPSNELMLEREDELDVEIPIAKDGSYGLPDATAQEEIDAKYYDRLNAQAEGYKGTIPQAHKAAAFQGLFQREIYIDENCDIFGDEIVVIEEIGSGDEPDFVIHHILRGADESEIKKFRQRANNGRLSPDKRGRQKFVQKSNLRSAMAFYQSLFKRMTGAKIGEKPFDQWTKGEVFDYVNALIQRRVVQVYVEALTGNLLD